MLLDLGDEQPGRRRRDREPDRGIPRRPVRRPNLDRHHVRQPAAALARLVRLCSHLRGQAHRSSAALAAVTNSSAASRNGLPSRSCALLAERNAKIEFGAEVVAIDTDPEALRVTLATGDRTEVFKPRYLLGAGGAHDISRHSMHEHLVGYTYGGGYVVADVKFTLRFRPRPPASWSTRPVSSFSRRSRRAAGSFSSAATRTISNQRQRDGRIGRHSNSVSFPIGALDWPDLPIGGLKPARQHPLRDAIATDDIEPSSDCRSDLPRCFDFQTIRKVTTIRAIPGFAQKPAQTTTR